MRRPIYMPLLLAAIAISLGADWRQFRGTENRSVGETSVPVQLDSEQCVAWKSPLPGTGPSSPIVVNDRVFVTAASGPKQDRLHVLAFSAASGQKLWERQLWATGHSVCNPYGGVATPTPASDGRRVFAFFSSNDLACFDLDGNLLWLRGLAYESPATRNDVGMASSPLVVGDTVIVQMECQGASFATGIDVATGETRWRLPRESVATWTSPTRFRPEGSATELVLLQSRSCLTAHEPQTGKEVWRFDADCSTISSPTAVGSTLYVPANGGIVALGFDSKQPIPKTLWEDPRLRIENVSPVIHEGRLYAIRSGILVCADASSGKTLWQLRLKGTIWATPVIAAGHLYAVNHDGLVQVVRIGDEGRLVGTRPIDKKILASPAIADGAIYFRSNEHLWKIGR